MKCLQESQHWISENHLTLETLYCISVLSPIVRITWRSLSIVWMWWSWGMMYWWRSAMLPWRWCWCIVGSRCMSSISWMGMGRRPGIGTHLWRWIAWPHSLGIGRSHRSHRISIGRSTLIRSGHLWLRHRAIPRCFGCHGVAVRHRGSRGSRGRGRRGRRDQTASRGIGHGHGRSSLDVPADRWRIQ